MDTNPMAQPCQACGHPKSAHTDLRTGGRLGCYRHPCGCSDFKAPQTEEASS